MISFNIEIAGVAAEIRCRFEENKAFLQDYISDKEAQFTIEPADADLRSMQQEFDRMAENDGLAARTYSDSFLENNAIHALLAEKLVEYNVLLIHGSALCMDGEAYIFIARSGTGKSTHAGLWREVFGDRVRMINDDKPMLRIERDSVTVYGTPWDGKHHLSRNMSAPLKAIIVLGRSEINQIDKMSKADAFPELMKHALVSKDACTMTRIIDLEKQLLDLADFYILKCNMKTEAAETVWKAMNGECSAVGC